MAKYKKLWKAILYTGCAFVCIALIACIWCAYHLKTDPELETVHYTYYFNIESDMRIVHLSDLHNASFGEGNRQLIDTVLEAYPDMIFITGDMLNREEENIDVVLDLVSELSKIAPVYYGCGNHEYSWMETWGRDLRPELTSAGAIVVDNDFVDTEINGCEVRIGGYMGYYRQPGMMTSNREQKERELSVADEFENTDRFKMLLNHIPTAWVDWGYIDKYPVDLVFSGHYHGGVVRLPIIDRGVFAPYVGWFPPYTKGIYEGSNATCIISAGLGSEHAVPRINNPPEIVVVDLVPAA